jgi:hypothetical protein
MDQIKEDTLRLIEATGLWPQYPLLQMKQWDDAKNEYAFGVLKDLDTGQYQWWPGDSFDTFRATQPLLIGKPELERLIDNGWMVDC